MHQKHPGPWEGSQNRGTLAGEIRRLPGAQLPQMCALSSGALLSFLSSAQQLSSKRGPGGAWCSKAPAWVAWTGELGGALGWASERGLERCSRGPGPWTDQRRDPAQGRVGAAPPSYTQPPLWGPRPYWVQKLLLKGGETARGGWWGQHRFPRGCCPGHVSLGSYMVSLEPAGWTWATKAELQEDLGGATRVSLKP